MAGQPRDLCSSSRLFNQPRARASVKRKRKNGRRTSMIVERIQIARQWKKEQVDKSQKTEMGHGSKAQIFSSVSNVNIKRQEKAKFCIILSKWCCHYCHWFVRRYPSALWKSHFEEKISSTAWLISSVVIFMTIFNSFAKFSAKPIRFIGIPYAMHIVEITDSYSARSQRPLPLLVQNLSS